MFVLLFGIYGVVLGTIAALLYRTTDMILYSNKRLLERSPWVTIKKWQLNIVLFVAVDLLVRSIHLQIHSFLSLVLSGMLLSAVIFPIFFIVNSLFVKEGMELLPEVGRKIAGRFRPGKKAAAEGGPQ
ncbi:hypothetical protein D3C87_1802170 [compost metagenome]